MSFTRSILQCSSGLLRGCRNLSSLASGVQKTSFISKQLQSHRSFTRSMWSLCTKPTGILGVEASQGQGSTASGWSKPCGCCGLHTTGDQDLVAFLGEEIEHEKKTSSTSGKLPKIRGFNVSKNGSEVVLTKEADGEKITVEMNINHSVQDASGGEYEEQNQGNEAAEMVAQPALTVKINKGGELTLAIQCEFPEPDGLQPPAEGQQGYDDAIEISEVAILRGDWDDKVYAVSGTVMDGNLYDMLMNMMEERGITGEVIDDIVEFATSYDQEKYIQFLQELQSFANAK